MNFKIGENETVPHYINRIWEWKRENAITNKVASKIVNEELISSGVWMKNNSDGYIRTIANIAAICYNDKKQQNKIKYWDNSVLFLNDIHAPFEREDLLDIIKKHKNEINTLVIGGDFLDCKSISKFPQIKSLELVDELIYGYNLLKKIRSILDNNQQIIMIMGNHEERLYTTICKMHEKNLQKFINPHILSMYVKGFSIYDEEGNEQEYKPIEGVTYVPHWYVNLDDKVIVSHPRDFSSVDGKMCEKVADYFLNKKMEFEALLFAHTHKYTQMKVDRRQGVYVVENGCTCQAMDYSDKGKLSYNPQDYCYTIMKWNNNEPLDINNIRVYHLKEEIKEIDQKDKYKIKL